MQTLTGMVGALSAEKIAAAYRKLLPAPFRVRMQRTAR
jgi:hypothetical protein